MLLARLSLYSLRGDLVPIISPVSTSKRYPYIATEVLCSDIWSIVETCVREQQQLLVPFWETVLERSADDMKTQMTMATHFVKINSTFLSKKPSEVLCNAHFFR